MITCIVDCKRKAVATLCACETETEAVDLSDVLKSGKNGRLTVETCFDAHRQAVLQTPASIAAKVNTKVSTIICKS